MRLMINMHKYATSSGLTSATPAVIEGDYVVIGSKPVVRKF